jgi:hypothetical protein
LQSVPCPINLAGYFFYTYDPSEWNKAVEEQALYYGQCASWSDDDEGSQLMALAVLDDIPTEVVYGTPPLNTSPLTLALDHRPNPRRRSRAVRRRASLASRHLLYSARLSPKLHTLRHYRSDQQGVALTIRWQVNRRCRELCSQRTETPEADMQAFFRCPAEGSLRPKLDYAHLQDRPREGGQQVPWRIRAFRRGDRIHCIEQCTHSFLAFYFQL